MTSLGAFFRVLALPLVSSLRLLVLLLQHQTRTPVSLRPIVILAFGRPIQSAFGANLATPFICSLATVHMRTADTAIARFQDMRDGCFDLDTLITVVIWDICVCSLAALSAIFAFNLLYIGACLSVCFRREDWVHLLNLPDL